MEAALELAPLNTEYRFLYCLLKERTGEPSHEAKACYAEVAEARKEQFLSLPATEPESDKRRHVLEGFDRTRYLRTILP